MNSLKAMFGFFFNQPIYKSLQQMKTIQVIALYITSTWIDELLQKIPPLPLDADVVMMGVYFTNALALVTIWVQLIKEMPKKHEE